MSTTISARSAWKLAQHLLALAGAGWMLVSGCLDSRLRGVREVIGDLGQGGEKAFWRGWEHCTRKEVAGGTGRAWLCWIQSLCWPSLPDTEAFDSVPPHCSTVYPMKEKNIWGIATAAWYTLDTRAAILALLQSRCSEKLKIVFMYMKTMWQCGTWQRGQKVQKGRLLFSIFTYPLPSFLHGAVELAFIPVCSTFLTISWKWF